MSIKTKRFLDNMLGSSSRAHQGNETPDSNRATENVHESSSQSVVGTEWRVGRSGVVLRERMDKDSKMISIIPPGTIVRVVEVNDMLQKLMRLDDPYAGWVNRFDYSARNPLLYQVESGARPLIIAPQSNARSVARAAMPPPIPPPPAASASRTLSKWIVIGELGAVVRESMDVNSPQVTTLPSGAIVSCLEIVDRRMKICSDLIVGWASIHSAEGYQILQMMPEKSTTMALTAPSSKLPEKFNSEGVKTTLVPNTFHHDEHGNKVNKAFHHYCGQEVTRSGYIFPCSICDGRCGPSNGCQCFACYFMDASLDETPYYSQEDSIQLPPPAPVLKREFSEQSEAIIKNEGTTVERQQAIRNALSSIKSACNAGRINLREKNTLKDQMCGSLLYTEQIIQKLSREEERTLRVELALRLKDIVDNKKKQAPSVECTLCMEPFSDVGVHAPHVLPCGHTFCLGCIRNLPMSNRMCPVDRRVLPADERDMPVNFGLTEILRMNL